MNHALFPPVLSLRMDHQRAPAIHHGSQPRPNFEGNCRKGCTIEWHLLLYQRCFRSRSLGCYSAALHGVGIFIGQVKGNSSHLASRLGGEFAWQSEYGVITISESHLTSVVQYVLNQQEHHDAGDMNARLEQWE